MGKLEDMEKTINARLAKLDADIGNVTNVLDPNGIYPELSPGWNPAAEVQSSLQPPPAPAGSRAADSSAAVEKWAVAPRLLDSVLEDVSKLNVRVVGGPPANMSGLNNEGVKVVQWAMKLAEGSGVPLGCLDLCGNPIEFPKSKVQSSGLPKNPDSDSPDAVQLNVLRAMAYYKSLWKYSAIEDVTVLWRYMAFAQDSGVVQLKDLRNAYSSFRGYGRTVLCFSKVFSDLDTMGHEFTHSVSQERIGWAEYKGETGALNESFSDIFAIAIRQFCKGRRTGDRDFWIFSKIRNLAHPDQIPESKRKVADWIPASWYKEPEYTLNGVKGGWYMGKKDNGGVHINNGPIARLFFLLCDGEEFKRSDGKSFKVAPIYFKRAEQLFGELLFGRVPYLGSAAGLYDMAEALELAARDLSFSSKEMERIRQACDAVNIIRPASSCGAFRAFGRRLRSVPGARSADVAAALAYEFSAELGLDATGAGYVVSEAVAANPGARSSMSETHFMLEQTFGGLPVYGASAIARVRGGDTATYFNNGFSRRLSGFSARDAIGEAGAVRAVAAAERDATVTSASKVVFDPAVVRAAGSPALAWLVRTAFCGSPSNQYLVDAETGRILRSSPLRTSASIEH